MASIVAAELLTPLDSVVYKSVRTHEDRLDSSPLELQFRLGAPFLAKVLSLYQKQYDEQVGHHDADYALQSAFQELVSCEILYYNDEVPMVYVEHDPNSESKDGVLTPISPPELRFFLDESTKRLTVAVERRFPLSSAHGGRPFRLAFIFGPSVLKTRKFCVMAKKGKAGTERKRMRPQKVCALSSRRLHGLELIKSTMLSSADAAARKVDSAPATSAAADALTRRKRPRRDSSSSSSGSTSEDSSVRSFACGPADHGEGIAEGIAQPWTPPSLSPNALRIGASESRAMASNGSVGSTASSPSSSASSTTSTSDSFRTPTGDEAAMPLAFPRVPTLPFRSTDFPDLPADLPADKFARMDFMPTSPHSFHQRATSKDSTKDVLGGGGGGGGIMTWDGIMDGAPIASPEELRDLLDFESPTGDFNLHPHDDFVVLPLGLEEPSKDLF